MNILISTVGEDDSIRDPNSLLKIFNTEKKEIINSVCLDKVHNSSYDGLLHAMGMCYLEDDLICIGIIPKSHRLTSYILTINTTTKIKKLHKLSCTKAIHSICKIGPKRILAISTQNDKIMEITLDENKIYCEDIYFDFITNRNRIEVYKEFTTEEELKIDDNYHLNSIYKHTNNDIYVSMFIDYNYPPKNIYPDEVELNSGVIFNLTKNRFVFKLHFSQPHSFFINSSGNPCFCESSEGTFLIPFKLETYLNGYTRGVLEDKELGGYWIGTSAHRKKDRLGNWKTFEKNNEEDDKWKQSGMGIHFVNYNGDLKESIDLSNHGKEIYDLLPINNIGDL
jgi:hypothetical protein